MKKTILVVLMVVLVATPCLAQEIEPDGMFTLDNTVWDFVDEDLSIIKYGFADGGIYSCATTRQDCGDAPLWPAPYFNLFFFSIFVVNDPSYHENEMSGIVIPILGIGWAKYCDFRVPCRVVLMKKLPDFFDPDVYNPSL